MNEICTRIASMSAYELASSMEFSAPDSLESPGAKFLSQIRDEFLESLELDWGYDVNDVVDAAVPLNTYDAWKVFLDLELYHSIDTPEEGNMTEKAYAMLFEAGAMLWNHLYQMCDSDQD